MAAPTCATIIPQQRFTKDNFGIDAAQNTQNQLGLTSTTPQLLVGLWFWVFFYPVTNSRVNAATRDVLLKVTQLCDRHAINPKCLRCA